MGLRQGCVFGKCKEFQTSQYLHQYRKLSLINCPQAQQSVTKNTSDYKLPGYKVPSKCIEMNSIYYRLRAVRQDGHASEESASEEIERSERKPRGSWGGGGKGGRFFFPPLSSFSLGQFQSCRA